MLVPERHHPLLLNFYACIRVTVQSKHLQGVPQLQSKQIDRVHPLLDTANVVPSSPVLVTLMMEALRSRGTSVVTRATRHNILEDDIVHSHRRENLKSYIALTG
jgi:hypothetical protein